MWTIFVGIKSSVKPFGLLFTPTVEPFIDDNDQRCPSTQWYPEDNSKNCLKLVRNIVKYKPKLDRILEIGVAAYSDGNSLTWEILKNKRDAYYFGVDLADRCDIVTSFPHSEFIRCSSKKQEKIRGLVDKLDLLVIDGVHNLSFCLNDWKYADLLNPGGIVIIHDTNGHPGPFALVEAIDPSLFQITKFFENQLDYGITVCVRRN